MLGGRKEKARRGKVKKRNVPAATETMKKPSGHQPDSKNENDEKLGRQIKGSVRENRV